MAVVRGEFVHFHIRQGGGVRKCQISQAALLIRERLDRQDCSVEILLKIFGMHRPEIERLAQTMAKRSMSTHRSIIITTAEFNA